MTILANPMYRSMLACVRERPDDDGPRLVMADWLEEQGESDRSEFIRKQIEFSNWTPYSPPPEIEEIAASGRLYARMAAKQIEEMREKKTEEKSDLAERIEHLLILRGQQWTLEVVPEGHMPFWPNADVWMTGCIFRRPPPEMRLATPGAQLWWRRGFVQKARSPWGKWSHHGDVILAAQPVTEVEIVGPVPIHLVADRSRFVRRDAPRTWRLREKELALPSHATSDTIVRSLLRMEWPSVHVWSAGSEPHFNIAAGGENFSPGA